MKKLLFIAFSLIMMMALAGCGGKASGSDDADKKTYTIKIGNGNPAGEPSADTLDGFVKEELEKRSDGQFKVQVYLNSQLGSETELLEQVKSGTLQIATPSAPSYLVPDLSVYFLPYLFETQDELWKITDGPIGEGLTKQLEEKTNSKVLGWWSTGIRHIFSKDKEIRHVDDLKGMKIRVMEIPVLMDVFKGLGALPTPLPYSDVYGSLTTNVVDGADNDPSGYKNMKFYEVANNFSISNTLNYPKAVVINEDFYNSLPEDLQKVIDEVFAEAQEKQRALFMDVMDSDIEELKEKGVNVIEDVDIESFKNLAEPIWRGTKDINQDLLNEILESRN